MIFGSSFLGNRFPDAKIIGVSHYERLLSDVVTYRSHEFHLVAGAKCVGTGLSFCGSMALLGKARTLCTIIQVVGSGCFLGVVLTHSSQALRSWTDWLAVAGLAIFSTAFLFHALLKK